MKHCYAYAMMMAFFLCLANVTYAAQESIPGQKIQTGNSGTIYNNDPIINIIIGVSQEMINSMYTQVCNRLNAVYQTAHNAYEQSAASLASYADWVSNNKIKSTLYTSAAVYVYVTYKLFTLKYMLIQPDNWSLWNNTLSYDDLHGIPEKQLGEILIKEAQQRYTVINEPENFMLPIVTFLQTVEHEKQVLQSYISLSGWISTLHVNKIMWFDEQLARTCEERLKRLAYLRAIFINWITEYKFMQNALPKAST